MALEGVLAAIAGGLRGGAESYRWQSDRRDRRQAVDDQNQIRQQEIDRKTAADRDTDAERKRQLDAQQAIIDSLPDTNADGSPNTLKTALRVQYASPKSAIPKTVLTEEGQTTRNTASNTSRENVATTAAESRESVAKTNQEGANYRHDNASGNAIANNKGAMDRLTKNIDFGVKKLTTDSADRRYGINTRSQDSRYSTDTSAKTTQRGQDKTFQIGQERNANALTVGQERNKVLGQRRANPYDGLFTPQPLDPNSADPAAAPAAAPAPPKGTIPVTPRATSQSAAAQPVTAPKPVDDITDADLDTLAKSVLDSKGIPSTPENIKTFKDRNRDKLLQQIKSVRGGGAQ